MAVSMNEKIEALRQQLKEEEDKARKVKSVATMLTRKRKAITDSIKAYATAYDEAIEQLGFTVTEATSNGIVEPSKAVTRSRAEAFTASPETTVSNSDEPEASAVQESEPHEEVAASVSEFPDSATQEYAGE